MSWEQYKAIRHQDMSEARTQAQDPPAACPIDGSLLDIRSDGIRNCPMGNYRWSGGPKQ